LGGLYFFKYIDCTELCISVKQITKAEGKGEKGKGKRGKGKGEKGEKGNFYLLPFCLLPSQSPDFCLDWIYRK